jgi:hypothetical protein
MSVPKSACRHVRRCTGADSNWSIPFVLTGLTANSECLDGYPAGPFERRAANGARSLAALGILETNAAGATIDHCPRRNIVWNAASAVHANVDPPSRMNSRSCRKR